MSSSKDVASSSRTTPQMTTNPRGIPHAPFISSVEEHVGGPDAEVESTLKQFQDAIAKYRYMEVNLQQRKKGLVEKIPDIQKTLAMVSFLQERRNGKAKKDDDEDDLSDSDSDSSPEPLKTTFELSDTLYAEAELEDTDQVYLWLGANVMLSYPLSEAHSLLTAKLSSAQTSLTNTTEDLEFLREQTTVMEVNTARVYNWDVKRRRDKREREAIMGTGKDDS